MQFSACMGCEVEGTSSFYNVHNQIRYRYIYMFMMWYLKIPLKLYDNVTKGIIFFSEHLKTTNILKTLNRWTSVSKEIKIINKEFVV